MATELDRLGAKLFPWYGKENDVLSRFHACAHYHRWHPDSVIVRVTADDWCKDPAAMKRVANGERLPAEIGGEAFTLAMLDEAHQYSDEREHLTHALFEYPAPMAPFGTWSIDTQADYQTLLSVLDAT
jgi:spore coat polysaccharide biosynthesis protein SpsF (cytidylyltransferase family)